MLAVMLAIVCSDPRAYDGLREVRSEQPEIDPFEPIAEQPEPPSEIEPTPPRAPPEPSVPPIEPPLIPIPTGRGMLIAGGIFAGTGFLVSALSFGLLLQPCSTFCEPYGAVYSALAAPVPWLIGTGLLGSGMQYRSYHAARRRIEAGEVVAPPRRGLFGAGLAMLIVGTGTLVGTWPVFFINSFAQVPAGSVAVAGAMMLGASRGRRVARKEHLAFTPIITRTTAILSLRVRW